MAALSEPIGAPGLRRLQCWGSLNGLGAHPGKLHPLEMNMPRVPPTARTQRTISLSNPLYSFPDELISAPGLYLKPKPDAIALSYLNGASCNAGAKRLGIWDSTWNQREPSLERDTSYTKSICDPVKVRFPPILPPLGKREMQMV